MNFDPSDFFRGDGCENMIRSEPDMGYICPTDVRYDWTYYDTNTEKTYMAEKGLIVKCAGKRLIVEDMYIKFRLTM